MSAPRIKKGIDVQYPIPLDFILSFGLNEKAHPEPDLSAIRWRCRIFLKIIFNFFISFLPLFSSQV
jgi:hypothetical protein